MAVNGGNKFQEFSTCVKMFTPVPVVELTSRPILMQHLPSHNSRPTGGSLKPIYGVKDMKVFLRKIVSRCLVI